MNLRTGGSGRLTQYDRVVHLDADTFLSNVSTCTSNSSGTGAGASPISQYTVA